MCEDCCDCYEEINSLEWENQELEDKIAELQRKVEVLAVESVRVRGRHMFIRALALSILEHSGGRMDWRGAMSDARDLISTVDAVYSETPATDAALAEIHDRFINDAVAAISESGAQTVGDAIVAVASMRKESGQ